MAFQQRNIQTPNDPNEYNDQVQDAVFKLLLDDGVIFFKTRSKLRGVRLTIYIKIYKLL